MKLLIHGFFGVWMMQGGARSRVLAQLAMGLVLANTCFGQPPNVLFIAVDDLNNWTGYAGDPNAITPNMDQLASEGVFFSRAQCSYPLCGPSRASIMSGMYFSELTPSKTQIPDEEVEEKAEAMGSALLHTYLGNHGYKTMAVGKILHGHVPDNSVDETGGRPGWDNNYNAAGERIRSNWPPDLNPDTAETGTDWGIFVGDLGAETEEDMSDSYTSAWAVERLQETHDEPFMLMVGFLHPHVPWYVPQSYYDLYDANNLVMPAYNPDDWDDIPQAGLDRINFGYPRTEWAIENNQWTNIVHSYLANITFADAKIGLVLDALDASPYADNTIVILWSDHGYHMGEKNTFQKHTQWSRSSVAPLIIKAPGMTANADCSSVVSLIDIYPTLVDLCGLPPNDIVRGRSLKPLLENPELPWDHPAFTYKGGIETIQADNLRFTEYVDGSQELYDHANDPDEWTNLVGNVDYEESILALLNTYPYPDMPVDPFVFTFLEGSVWDGGAGGGLMGAHATLTNSVTGEQVTLTTVDVIGQDGSKASEGADHTTNISGTTYLGINDEAGGVGGYSKEYKFFNPNEGWVFSFDTDVYLDTIQLASQGDDAQLTLSSDVFDDKILTFGQDDDIHDIGHPFIPEGTELSLMMTTPTNGVDTDIGVTSITVSTVPFLEDSTEVLQAESYDAASGVSTSLCSDEGGGEMVEFDAAGGEISFDVYVPTSGTVLLGLRVASMVGRIQLDVQQNGTSIAGVQRMVADDGTWTTIYKQITLESGATTFRVVSSGEGCWLNWLEFKEMPSVSYDPENSALNRVYSASNVHSSNYGPEKAFDGDLETRWATSTDPVSLEVDFGEPVIVYGTRFYDYKDRIRWYEIQVYEDEWKTVFIGSNPDDEQTDWFPAENGSKVRLQTIASTGDPSIWEFEVFRGSTEPSMDLSGDVLALEWSTMHGVSYAVQSSTNLVTDPFSTTIESGIPSLAETNSIAVEIPEEPAVFYRVIAE